MTLYIDDNDNNKTFVRHIVLLKHLQLNDALILNLSYAKKFIEETFS